MARERGKTVKTDVKAKFILTTVIWCFISLVVLGICPMPIYWKIPAMLIVGVAEFLAVMMGYMCKEGDDD